VKIKNLIIAGLIVALVVTFYSKKESSEKVVSDEITTPISALSEQPKPAKKIRKAKFTLTAEQAARFRRLGLKTDSKDWGQMSVEN
jgi:hypothetical protein